MMGSKTSSSLVNALIKNPLLNKIPQEPMSTLRAVTLKKKAIPVLANDNFDNHSHIVKETCTTENCNVLKCNTNCNPIKKAEVLGHYTHKPPVGRMCKHISEVDAAGNVKSQYFVKTNEKKDGIQ